MKQFCLTLLSFLVLGTTYAQVSTGTDRGRIPSPNISKVKPGVSLPDAGNKVSLWTSDFSNMNDWVIGNSAGNNADWTISDAPYYWWSGNNALASTSGGYAASFNSDYYATANNQIENNAWIQTASPINCSGQLGVEVCFQQFYSKWTSMSIVEVSTDNGQTWSDFEVNAGMMSNEATDNPDMTTVNISSVAGGEPSVLIRILFLSNAISDGGTDNTAGVAWDYGWIIDDFDVRTLPANDIALLDAWHADVVSGYEYSMVGLSQVREMVPSVVIQNQGSMHQNVDVECTITGDSGIVNTITINHTSMFGATDTLYFYTGFIPSAIDNYEVYFTIPEDDDPTNDSIATMPLKVTNSVMAHDYGPENVYGWDPASADPDVVEFASKRHAWGNIYTIEQNETIYSVGVNFAQGTTDWLPVRVRVRQIPIGGSIQDPLIVNNYVDYNVPPSEIGNGITNVSFPNPSMLEAGKTYVIDVLKVDTATVDHALFIGGSEFDSEDDDFSTVGWGAYGNGSMPNYFTNWGFAPVIRANFSAELSTMEQSISAIEVYPNPSNGFVSISSEDDSDKSIQVMDLSGKIVASAVMQVKTTLDLSTVDSGVYLIQISNGGSTVTIRIVIQ